MNQNWIQRLRGFVHVEVKGSQLEKLVNRMVERRLSVWDIRFTGDERAHMYVTVSDFFKLRPLLKQTGCRIHVISRYGLPFLLDKLLKRKFFFIGLAGFIVGLYLLSSLVWQVKVEGNLTIPTENVLQAAKQSGVYKLQWKFRLQEPETLARSLQSKLSGTAWIGVEIRGTHVIIKVVEATVPDKRPLLSPRHLVAAKNAMITKILAEKGRPVVKVNSYVRKGDVLISGILGDEENRQTVPAAGEVKGLVWYAPKVEVPLTRSYKVYTGESKKRFYLVFGSKALQVTGYGKLPFDNYESQMDRKAVGWRNWALPFGWIHEKVMEVDLIKKEITLEEARAVGVEQAKAEILAEIGGDARVVSEKILHERTENGKVYMEVHLEVEESIAMEQAIVPQQEQDPQAPEQ